jgi:hypothetical protein
LFHHLVISSPCGIRQENYQKIGNLNVDFGALDRIRGPGEICSLLLKRHLCLGLSKRGTREGKKQNG